MSEKFVVSFDDQSFKPVQLNSGSNLSEHLSTNNAPLQLIKRLDVK
jgi:hypothetical protein